MTLSKVYHILNELYTIDTQNVVLTCLTFYNNISYHENIWRQNVNAWKYKLDYFNIVLSVSPPSRLIFHNTVPIFDPKVQKLVRDCIHRCYYFHDSVALFYAIDNNYIPLLKITLGILLEDKEDIDDDDDNFGESENLLDCPSTKTVFTSESENDDVGSTITTTHHHHRQRYSCCHAELMNRLKV